MSKPKDEGGGNKQRSDNSSRPDIRPSTNWIDKSTGRGPNSRTTEVMTGAPAPGKSGGGSSGGGESGGGGNDKGSG